MRIKLDENLSASCAVRLTALGHDVHTVIEEELSGHVDSEVWEAAQLEERFLITQDLDFSDRRRFAAGSHAGVLLVRLPDSKQWRLSDYPRRMVLLARGEHLGAVLRRIHSQCSAQLSVDFTTYRVNFNCTFSLAGSSFQVKP